MKIVHYAYTCCLLIQSFSYFETINAVLYLTSTNQPMTATQSSLSLPPGMCRVLEPSSSSLYSKKLEFYFWARVLDFQWIFIL